MGFLSMNKYAELIQQSGTDLPHDFQLSNEGASVALKEFLDTYTGIIRRVARKVLNQEVLIQSPQPIHKAQVDKILDDMGWPLLQKLKCYVPAKMNGKITEHLEELEEQIEAIVTIEKRLLDPLITLLAEVVGNPHTLEKVWIDKNLMLLNTDTLKKKLAKTFKADTIGANAPHQSTVKKAYTVKGEISMVSTKLAELYEKARYIDLGIIKDKEEKIANMIDDILDATDEVEVNKQTMVKLANAVSAASIEMELMSALYYYLVVNINAYNETIEHFRQVKEQGV